MNGLQGFVMIVENHSHARIVAHHQARGKLGVIGVVAVIDGAVFGDVLLEVPPAADIIGIGDGARFIAIEENFALVVDFHDEPVVDKREIEVSFGHSLSVDVQLGDAAVQGVEQNLARTTVLEIRYFYLGVGVDLADGHLAFPAFDGLSVDDDTLEVAAVADGDVCVKLRTEGRQVRRPVVGQVDDVVLTVDVD